jgi:hypothetical protein
VVVVAGEPEGDPESILRTADDSTWFAVCGDGRQPVWIEVLFPEYMRVVELSKYTFSHGMNLANHMFPVCRALYCSQVTPGCNTTACRAVWHLRFRVLRNEGGWQPLPRQASSGNLCVRTVCVAALLAWLSPILLNGDCSMHMSACDA